MLLCSIIISDNYQNYQTKEMSNIRDLQKLKNHRFMQPVRQLPHRVVNPECINHNYQPVSLQINNQKIHKNILCGKDTIRATPSKLIHKRGASFGTPDTSERHTFNLIQNPRLSIYNFPLKLDLHTPTKQFFHQQPLELPRTERKVKNNYVICKEIHPDRKETHAHKFTHTQHAHTQMSKAAFTRIMPVGKGGFGKVWKVELKRSKQIYAMKLMSKAKIISKKSVASVMNQRKFLAKLSHPFLVNMVYAFQDREHLYLIMDYLDGGDLRYHLGNRPFFNEKETKFFVANIILSLEYMHRHKIIHRDIKPQNLVFDSQGFLRLTDLGISRELREDNHQDTSGTPGYMAPEVMLRKSHSYAVDYFALGVIAYELMLGRRPYQGANRKEIKEQILARQACVKVDQLPYKWSPYFIDFVNKLLLRNPEQRLGSNGIEEIKEHPWLADVEWEKILSRKYKSPFKPMSIEEDYDNYKEQISQDTVNENQEEISVLLRKKETQQLFEGYYYEKGASFSTSKKTSFSTNYTEDNVGHK